MNMEKRVLLAIFLIAATLVISNLFFAPPPPDLSETTGSAIEDAEPVAQENPEPAPVVETAPPGHLTQVAPSNTGNEKTVYVENNRYKMQISSIGAKLESIELKDYPSSVGEGNVQLIQPAGTDFLGMRLTLESDTLDLSRLYFTPSRDRVDVSDGEKTLLFSHSISESDSILLRYTFTPDTYLMGVEVDLPSTMGGKDLFLHTDLLPRLLPTEADSERNDLKYFGTEMGGLTEERKKVDIGDIGGDKGDTAYNEGPFLWAGVKNKYFIAALVSKTTPMKGVITKGSEDAHRIGLTAITPTAEGGARFKMDLYIGPQDYHRLSSLGVGMEAITEYGWWIIRPFSRMIVIILLWMHQFIGNYGVVIILFSIMTKAVFYPLTQKSLKSTQDLQKIQPMLKELKEKHKDEPQKLQQETMRLYKEHKVNPLGGCLPMIVQMPVLWALFYVFRMTIEFRGASFALWIHDLSAPDSPPVLPVVMGLSMFLQQKLSPQSADPKMAPMMYIMPVVLTVVFINFSSGLVLYWTVNNILAIAQQYYLQKKTAAPAPVRKKPAPDPARD